VNKKEIKKAVDRMTALKIKPVEVYILSVKNKQYMIPVKNSTNIFEIKEAKNDRDGK